VTLVHSVASIDLKETAAVMTLNYIVLTMTLNAILAFVNYLCCLADLIDPNVVRKQFRIVA
jgi:hypothetical protein